MDLEQLRARDVLDDLLNVESGLTAWEMDFIEDMDGKRGRQWTEKQIDCLDRIYKRLL